MPLHIQLSSNAPLKAVEGSQVLGPLPPMGDPDGVLQSWLQSGPLLAATAILRREPADGSTLRE